jgi:predicted RNA-binding Zn ribbon-like protein
MVTSNLSFVGNRDPEPLNFGLVETRGSVSNLRLDGGHLALDFVNTLAGLLVAAPNPWDEFLNDYGDLLRWSQLTGVLDDADAERLSRLSRRRPADAASVLSDALDLRGLLDRIFRSIAEGDSPTERDLARLRDEVRPALEHGRLTRHGNAFEWSWPEPTEFDAPLWPLAYAAVELLTSGQLERVRCCGRCRWLFLDESRNRSRRWCSMEECGTAVKKERYVARRRARRTS